MAARRTLHGLAFLALAPLVARAQDVAAPQSPTTAQTPPDADFGTIELFNGRDFAGLTVFVGDDGTAAIARVEDGLLRITGVGRGYVRTNAAFADYKLAFQWRWPAQAGNSGLLFHLVNPDVIWPKGFEMQLKSGNAGDLSSYSDARSKDELVSRNPTGYSTGRLPRQAPADVEQPVGEWNRCEILAIGDAVIITINGREVNRMTGLVPNAGMIAFQAEGAAIDFRDVKLTVLPPAKDLHAPMPRP